MPITINKYQAQELIWEDTKEFDILSTEDWEPVKVITNSELCFKVVKFKPTFEDTETYLLKIFRYGTCFSDYTYSWNYKEKFECLVV